MVFRACSRPGSLQNKERFRPRILTNYSPPHTGPEREMRSLSCTLLRTKPQTIRCLQRTAGEPAEQRPRRANRSLTLQTRERKTRTSSRPFPETEGRVRSELPERLGGLSHSLVPRL